MMPAHQIWSCHVTQEANLENVLFCPNSTFNIGKSHKMSSGKPLYFRSYQPKTSREGWKHPSPVPLGLTFNLMGHAEDFSRLCNMNHSRLIVYINPCPPWTKTPVP